MGKDDDFWAGLLIAGAIVLGLAGIFAKPKCPACKSALEGKPPFCPVCRSPLRWSNG